MSEIIATISENHNCAGVIVLIGLMLIVPTVGFIQELRNKNKKNEDKEPEWSLITKGM